MPADASSVIAMDTRRDNLRYRGYLVKDDEEKRKVSFLEVFGAHSGSNMYQLLKWCACG